MAPPNALSLRSLMPNGTAFDWTELFKIRLHAFVGRLLATRLLQFKLELTRRASHSLGAFEHQPENEPDRNEDVVGAYTHNGPERAEQDGVVKQQAQAHERERHQYRYVGA